MSDMAKPTEPLNAHATAPTCVKRLQKYYQKLPKDRMAEDDYILDLASGAPATGWHSDKLKLSTSSSLCKELLQEVWGKLLPGFSEELQDKPVYEHESVPGLKIIPSLFPTSIQYTLLDRLLLRDLSDPSHKTNLHLHYSVPPSMFTFAPETNLQPHDPSQHKPLPLTEALGKKLRWMTLGGQYDWTAKKYPSETPPNFPEDIAGMISSLFNISPQAAIFNVYNSGDTLGTHRDVSEESDADLVSVSLGCDALFLISVAEETEEEEDTLPPVVDQGEQPPQPLTTSKYKLRKALHQQRQLAQSQIQHPGRDTRTLVVRLRSGDAVVMGGASRWAWHGVPKVLDEGCPEELLYWPDDSQDHRLRAWKGWMRGKRLNLNVRQMYT